MTELKSCPFCGGNAKIVRTYNGDIPCAMVICESCRVSMDCGIYDVVVETWNRRRD